MRICKRNRPFKKQEPLPHKFEWIEMEIAKNREEYGLMKTDLSKQKIGAPDKPCGVGRADANPKLLLNDT